MKLPILSPILSVESTGAFNEALNRLRDRKREQAQLTWRLHRRPVPDFPGAGDHLSEGTEPVWSGLPVCRTGRPRMSYLLVTQVFELDLPHGDFIVLLCLAHSADPKGKRCRLSVRYTARQTGYHERQVQRILRSLEKSRLICAVANKTGGRGSPTEYRLHLENGDKKAPFMRNQKGVIYDQRYNTTRHQRRGDGL